MKLYKLTIKTLSFCTTLIICGCGNLKYLTPFEYYNPNPKQVHVKSYNMGDSTKLSEEIVHFDKKGREIEDISFFKGRQDTAKFYKQYDRHGNTTSWKGYNTRGELILHSISEFDGRGKQIMHRFPKHKKSTLYYYNDKGKLVRTVTRDSTNTIISQTAYTILPKLRKKFTSIYPNRDAKIVDSLLELCEKPNIKYRQESTFNSTKNSYYITRGCYDNKGLLELKFYYINNNELTISLIQMDSLNRYNPLYRKFYSIRNGKLFQKKSENYQYSYDPKNNFVKSILTIDGQSPIITEQEITYW